MKTYHSNRVRTTSIFLLITFLYEFIYPVTAHALTGGPSQPEVQSFEPVGTSEMVDLFSGDFNYNIPLMDVGGYPVNIAYHAGINMDQEASWVGLGWNINAGVINREMRGLPDDFKGDLVKKEFKMRPNRTYGLNFSTPIEATEVFGLKLNKLKGLSKYKYDININLGITYNNYKGIGLDFGITPTFGFSKTGSSKLTAKLGFNYSTSNGINISPGINYSSNVDDLETDNKTYKAGFKIGSSFNSRYGLQALNYGFNASVQQKPKVEVKDGETHITKYSAFRKSISATHSFGVKTYTPNISMPMKTHSFSFELGFGPDFFANHFQANFSGSYSQQTLAVNESEKGAYGYLYEHLHPTVNDMKDHDFLLDYNRENDRSYSKQTTNLPLTSHTHDIYSVSGHGVGGSYRVFRSDIGIIGDDYSTITSTSANGGIELGTGNLAHWGGSLNMTFHRSESGAWIKDESKWYENRSNDYINASRNIFGFRGIEIGKTQADYEPAYFKKAGELVPLDADFYNVMRGDLAVSPDATSFENGSYLYFNTTKNVKPTLNGSSSYQTNRFVFKGSDRNDVIRKKREKRNEVFSYINNDERLIAGQDKYIRVAGINPDIDEPLEETAIAFGHPSHHTAEITILGKDGMRYIYGIAAYNNFQKEKTFNVSERTKHTDIGQVEYGSGDNSTSNDRGDDDFYSSTETPGYAHSYLLTGIVSSDYVDLTGNGISNDDYGTSVKINYCRVNSEYPWRTPYLESSASLMEGLRYTNKDDKGSYVYGTKEIWHISSIESKTHIAFFRISTREDGLGANGEIGGTNTDARSYKLDKIELYSKQDIYINGVNAKPVKVVNFQYDYSLCPDVENNSGNTGVSGNTAKGKLTLKKIWFTYGTSYSGRIAPYIFDYAGVSSQPGINPSYNLKGNDGWGTYKEMLTNTHLSTGNVSNSEYPYSSSDQETADENSFAWCLTKIQLPSGGTIKITYESDDYAYVENKRAMEMHRILGFGRSEDPETNKGSRIFYETGLKRHMDIVFFDIINSEDKDDDNQDSIKKKYFENIEYLQFTLLANIHNGNYEYVKGYCEIDWEVGCGVNSSGQGWVGVKFVHINDKDDGDARHMINPMAKTIWNFARINTPNLVYPAPDAESQSVSKQILSLFNVFGTDLYRNIRGINKSLEDQKFGAWVSTDKSWLRLNSPHKRRLGGGHRVKRIELSDNWQEMAYPSDNDASFSYGQEYEYTMTEKQTNGQIWTISSGVASNLPPLMGDENPRSQPIFTDVEHILVPDESFYNDRPIGESFFPGANVGYRRVTVKALSHENVKRTATGYTVNEFYTAYDYPTIVKQTDLYRYNLEPAPFFSMFQTKHETRVKASQGYCIELNDMHGKSKAEYKYSEGTTEPKEWSRNIYQTDSTVYPNKLYNKVLTIAPDKTIKEKEIGIEHDFIMDNRQQNSLTYTAGVEFNTEAMALLIFPVVVPCILPSYSKEDVEFKSSVGTKVIKKYGILRKTIVFKEGSTISTSNLLYDDQTGEVVLTSYQNEFNDNIYDMTYPAHWAYEGMGQAYKNIDFSISKVNIIPDSIVFPSGLLAKNFLIPGDECLITYPNMIQIIGWVYKGYGNKLNFIDADGSPLPYSNNTTIKVIRSGRRNQFNDPISSFTTMSNPLTYSMGNYSLSLTDIINTDAIEYKEEWKTHLDLLQEFECDTVTNANYANLKAFLAQISGHTSLVTPKYKPTSMSSLYRNDTLFTITCYKTKKYGGTYTFANDTFFYKDSIFLRYTYQDTSGQFYSYPYIFAEVVGIENVIPRPESFQIDGYDEFWIRVFNDNNNPSESLTSFTDISGLMDSLSKKLKYCGGLRDSNTNNLKVKLNYSSNSFNFKYSFYNQANDCKCDFEFIFYEPNRFKQILSIYDISPYSSQELKAKAIVLKDNNEHDTISFLIHTDCFELTNCDYKCKNNTLKEKIINPYRANMAGVWRPFRTYKFITDRTYQSASPNTRTDGLYANFSPFWSYNATSKRYVPNYSETRWVGGSEVTAYTPFGSEVENKDALGNYNASLYGYKNSVVIAVASNCKYNQLGFDGFEDYDSRFGTGLECDVNHFNFAHTLTDEEGIYLDNIQQHTGEYSLKVNVGNTAELSRTIDISPVPLSIDEHEVRVARLNDDLGVFRPRQGKYVFGAWIRSEEKIADTTYNNGLVEIEITDSSNVTTVISCNVKGSIIEGWQRVEQVFEIPANTKSITIKLKSGEESATWFDDIRIHTYDGNMNSYVYDSRLMEIRAELDQENYATFYEYDQSGALIRVKKETEKGIVTIKETRIHVKGTNEN